MLAVFSWIQGSLYPSYVVPWSTRSYVYDCLHMIYYMYESGVEWNNENGHLKLKFNQSIICLHFIKVNNNTYCSLWIDINILLKLNKV